MNTRTILTATLRTTMTTRVARVAHVTARSLVSDTTASSSRTPATAQPSPVTTSHAHDLPPVHPRTHGVHIASLTLRAHHPAPLTQFAEFALHAAHSLGIPVSRPAALPVERSLYTVLKSPFVHKKAQENFEKKYHARVIKVWDAEREVVDKWLRYLKKYSVGGVGMKAVVHDWVALDEQSTSTATATTTTTTTEAAGESVAQKVMHAVEGITRDLKEEVEQAAGKAREVVESVAEAVVPETEQRKQGKQGKQ
ncbi:mitochondrial 37S ribosomal protein rsm10 [Naganishia albida]|nr:mitochondrial 37S ribosomal protein rsm10 [Naganishia albida]